MSHRKYYQYDKIKRYLFQNHTFQTKEGIVYLKKEACTIASIHPDSRISFFATEDGKNDTIWKFIIGIGHHNQVIHPAISDEVNMEMLGTVYFRTSGLFLFCSHDKKISMILRKSKIFQQSIYANMLDVKTDE